MHELDLLFSYKILHPLKFSIEVSHPGAIGLKFTPVNTDGSVLNNLERDTGLLLNGQGVLCMRLSS
jgi:hypothetical protein